MCGRYALHLWPSQVRQRLADQHMPADEAPPDDDRRVRQSYNFAPGQHGLIYRADTSDYGFGDRHTQAPRSSPGDDGDEPAAKRTKRSHPSPAKPTTYKLQAAKWGLIPSWTRRAPDYANQLKTINCRDDSLLENRGLWNTMKARKRCVVVAEGFYEWLKKNNGKERVPHHVKRKDGQLMCFAGLWDVCTFETEGAKVGEEGEKVYSYTIITTDSNAQLKFLHDRMPVIFEAGSEEMKHWLDPEQAGWDRDLQKSLKPFQGELDCYVVDKAVGKVGNDKPSFVVPIDSSQNKSNIANFFVRSPVKVKKEDPVGSKDEGSSGLVTSKVEDPESNAPLPKPEDQPENEFERALQQQPRTSFSTVQSSTSTLRDDPGAGGWDDDDDDDDDGGMSDVKDEELSAAADRFVDESIKREVDDVDDEALFAASSSPPRKLIRMPSVRTRQTPSKRSIPASHSDEKEGVKEDCLTTTTVENERPSTPTRPTTQAGASKTRSATSNSSALPKTPSKTPSGSRDAKITSFFDGKG